MSWFSETVDYDISSCKIELDEEKSAPPTPPSGWDDYQREYVSAICNHGNSR